jgi:type IV pilus assembly protein PilB
MLGERLLDLGLVTERQLDLAMREQRRTGAMIGEILTQLGLVTHQSIASVLAEQGGVTFLDLAETDIPVEALALVPEAVARRLNVIPVALDGAVLVLAMANIYDVEALGEVESLTRRRVRVVGASEEDILASIADAYGERKSIEELIEEAIQATTRPEDSDPGGLPVVRLVNQLLVKAIQDRATDLHVQPGEHTVLTRFRVDGLLQQGPSLPKAIQQAITARIKILAEANIAETRVPQDGKFQFRHGKRRFDLRVNFLPNIHGEKVVLRVLDKTRLVLGLDQLGMPESVLADFQRLLTRPHGVLLVTGPTGSGKTTTLYSALSTLNSSDRCIVTVEDPVEYEMPLVTQTQVNVKAGLGFGEGLRAILRQDPDIILIGEIRDQETAEIASRAAMTGHLVLSTLHTNDPISAIPRLVDLGLSRLDLSSTLLGVLSQRLVRVNCPACVAPEPPHPDLLTLLKPEQRTGNWSVGRGCESCGHTGVRGRRAIHDLLCISPDVRELLTSGVEVQVVEAQARLEGKSSLFEHALHLAQSGIISLDEALRVTAAED